MLFQKLMQPKVVTRRDWPQALSKLPAGDNAVEVLQRILALQPNQPRAIETLNQIATGYEKVALTWRDRGRPDQALAQVRNGLKAQPTNARLLRLEQQLR